MKLMTKTVASKIPELRSTENEENPEIVLHYFNPCGSGDWYVLEGEEQENGDWLFFGYVKGLGFDELGYFTLNELKSVKLFGGLGIERDLHWNVKKLEDVK